MDTKDIVIQPGCCEWGGMVRGRLANEDRARRFRSQMGLPVDRPVIFAGHQSGFWHPGILAKALAQAAAGRAFGAATAWVVVDQDDHDPWTIRYPVRLADGRLEAREWNSGTESASRAEHVPVVNLAARRPEGVPALRSGERFAAPGLADGLSTIAAAMGRHASEPTAARQISRAMDEVIRPLGASSTTVFASDLSGTDLFAEVIEAIRRDPGAAINAYNAAVAAHPGARIAPLRTDGDAELPLWHIPRVIGAPRRRVTVSMVGSGGSSIRELAPRALLMTGLLRWAGCEVFVHGMGGAGDDGSSGYDAITTDWFRSWLGAALAPTATVSATLRLNFEHLGGTPRLTPEQIDRARWTAHAARHRPQLLGDAVAEAERYQAVATLRRLRWKRDPAAKRAKLDVYRALHQTLAGVRDRRAAELSRIEREAATAAARRGEAQIIADRTWAWPLYEAGQVADLRRTIDAAFGM